MVKEKPSADGPPSHSREGIIVESGKTKDLGDFRRLP
jgi:hypothetical protein